MAPCARLSSLLASTRSGSTSNLVPRPVQVGQAPWGVLNEKLRGSSDGSDVPSYGQANCSAYRRSAHVPSGRGWLMITCPEPIFTAGLTDSAIRDLACAALATHGRSALS